MEDVQRQTNDILDFLKKEFGEEAIITELYDEESNTYIFQVEKYEDDLKETLRFRQKISFEDMIYAYDYRHIFRPFIEDYNNFKKNYKKGD